MNFLTIKFGIATTASPQHEENEDAAEFISGNTAILADGMGGEANPALASHTAVETIKQELIFIPPDASSEQNKEYFIQAIQKANKELLEKVPGGGSTLSIAKIVSPPGMVVRQQAELLPGGRGISSVLVHANTGDSRIGIFRELKLISLTEDQGLLRACYENPNIAQQYRQQPLTLSRYKEIQKKLNEVTDISKLDAEERFYFDHRNIIFGGIGISPNPRIDSGIENIEIGDKIILMSDGVHDNLTTQQIEEILLETKDQEPLRQAGQLVQNAKEISEKSDSNGRGKPDDITAVAVCFAP